MSIAKPLLQSLNPYQCEDIRGVLEKQRKHDFSAALNWLIGGFTMALLFLLGGVFTEINPLGAIIAVMIALVIPIFVIFQKSQSYQTLYTTLVVQEFIRYYNTQDDVQLSYVTLGGISQSTFIECGLFETPTYYRSTDLIKGTIDKTEFECAHIFAEGERIVYTKNGPRKQKYTIFKGMYYVVDFNKNFKGSTIIVPDNVEGMLGDFGHSLQKAFGNLTYKGLELAYMENPQFERDFAVYTTDQIEARYLLTPFIIERMVELRNMCSGSLRFAFRFGKLHIGWSTPGHWIQPPGITRQVTTEVIGETQNRLLIPLQLVDRFELNTRIWGKS